MIVKTVFLPLAPQAAFHLFVQKIDLWWPPERRHARDRASEIFLLASGRFFERGRDGQEVELGCVRAWEFPNRILLDFFIGSGPERPTEVEIVFETQGEGAKLTLTHRPKPSSEALWSGTAPKYSVSWDIVLAAFARAAGASCVS